MPEFNYQHGCNTRDSRRNGYVAYQYPRRNVQKRLQVLYRSGAERSYYCYNRYARGGIYRRKYYDCLPAYEQVLRTSHGMRHKNADALSCLRCHTRNGLTVYGLNRAFHPADECACTLTAAVP